MGTVGPQSLWGEGVGVRGGRRRVVAQGGRALGVTVVRLQGWGGRVGRHRGLEVKGVVDLLAHRILQTLRIPQNHQTLLLGPLLPGLPRLHPSYTGSHLRPQLCRTFPLVGILPDCIGLLALVRREVPLHTCTDSVHSLCIPFRFDKYHRMLVLLSWRILSSRQDQARDLRIASLL